MHRDGAGWVVLQVATNAHQVMARLDSGSAQLVGIADAIRNVRVSLLAEHSGLAAADAAGLKGIKGLVARLDALADRAGARLQRHGAPTPTQQAAMQVVDPDDLPFDPETTAADEAEGRLDPSDEHSGRRRLPVLAAAVGGVGAIALAGLLARYIGRLRR